MRQIILLSSFLISFVFGKVNLITSITDLADIAKTIGGERVNVSSIARGNQDPHYVEVLPSYMMKVKRAHIYLKVGMEMDLWAQLIIDGSRNRKLQVVDCSQGINRLEVPTDKVDARLGDIHRYGNPHYWLDPENGKIIAWTILDALVEADPEGRSYYESNLEEFIREVDDTVSHWLDTYSTLRGKKIIFYHNSWPYFSNRFGLKTVQFVEPKPGIMPTPSHLDRLIRIIQSDNVKVVAMEPYFSDRAPKFLAEKTGVKVVKLAQSVEALPEASSYLLMLGFNLRTLSQLFQE